MYTVRVTSIFSAAHALLLKGEREPLHGHDWRVTASFEGETLDADGLLVDFHAVEGALRAATARLSNANLNDLTPFVDGVNPSAENVARVIWEDLTRRCASILPGGAALGSVSVTEAPGCEAEWRGQHRGRDR